MLNTIVFIIPVLLVVAGLEWYLSYKHEKKIYTAGNFVINVAIGAMDQVFSLVYFVGLYISLQFVYDHFRLLTLQPHWYHWITAYVVIDFLSYWYHRFSHRINFLWAGHVTHHSSEHFNFSNGFRTSFFQGINRVAFWSCLPLFGFSPVMLVILLKISGLYDFLLHNQHVPKLGWLEKILVTPSHHRVHHGRNDIYIDKNYSSTFIIWDKLFGTFQEETVPVEYGIKGPYVDNNPFMAIGYYYYYLWKCIGEQSGLFNKIRLLFLAPDRTPKPNENSLALIRQSNPFGSIQLRQYAWLQLAVTVPAMIIMLLFKDFIPLWEFIFYAVTGISAVGCAARILNNNAREQVVIVESLRLSIALFFMLIMYVVTHKLYMVPIALFMACALVVVVLSKHSPSDEWSQRQPE